MPTVASVHRHWRSVALSTSALWSSLVMSLDQVVRLKSNSDAGEEPTHTTFLDVQRLATHIARSRTSPVDILIDTRDPDWDFEENEEECPDYGATSSPYAAFIPKILSILSQQMYRWRSVTILSGTWAPLRAALEYLSVPTMENATGAPCLETIMLMRCNEFFGHTDAFIPRSQPINGIPFAALMGDPTMQPRPLPKLRNITLVGVHVNWTDFYHHTLGTALDQPHSRVSSCLQSLEFSHHCREVRPSYDEFSEILKACPFLRRLVIKVSGPRFDEEIRPNDLPVSLHRLEELHIGYTSVEDTTLLLSRISAPNLVTLSIEDANHITHLDDEDASTLLTYCATGMLNSCEVFAEASSDLVIKPPFPHLERLSLDSVNACTSPISFLMTTLPKLHHLTLRRTPNALAALLPTQIPFADTRALTIPCPGLKSIKIFCAEEQTRHVLDLVLRERKRNGTMRVPNVDIHLEVYPADLVGGFYAVQGDAVEMQATYEDWKLNEEDQFALGGIFNDPYFDEAYRLVS